MKKSEIKVGGFYLAKVSGTITTVRVDAIEDGFPSRSPRGGTATNYRVTNLRTGCKTTFRSAAKFRYVARCSCGRDLEPDRKRSGVCKWCIRTKDTVLDPKDTTTAEIQNKEGWEEKLTESILRGEFNVDGLEIEKDGKLLGGREILRRLEQEASEEADPTDSTDSQDSAQSAEPSGAMGSTRTATAAEASEDKQCSDPTFGASATPPAGSPPKDGTAQSTSPSLGVAARVVAMRQTRQPGTQVAGITPNEEQERILDAAVQPGLRVLVVGAGAGTGKTATLKMLEQVLPGKGQYTAFNSSLVIKSKGKFKKAACNTTHSLAFRAVGKQYQHRLDGERMRSGQIARILGINPLTITLKGAGEPETDANGKPTGRNFDKNKTLQAGFLAGQVIAAIRRFCQSADSEIGNQHLRYIDGIDVAGADGKMQRENNDRVWDYLLPFCKKAWEDLNSVNGTLPYQHDYYVKTWQLGTGNDRPIIAADYILLDEAQDTAPVFLDILKQQTHALLVFVGDSNQAIYEWRGAVDAMKAYPDATRRLLSQSYRFGQAVADVANAILATLGEPTDLRMRGMPGLPTRVDTVTEPRCYLYRTNAGAVGRVMTAIGEGKKPHLIGGGAEVVAWCQAAMDLQAKRGTQHPDLACFDTWKEVVEYSKTDEGTDLRLMVKLVTDFGAQEIRDALKDMPKEENADLVISTAHKSKGREWDTVRLGQDFPTINKMSDAEKRLLYVAATRAKLVLDISECPTFCGGYDGKDTGNEEKDGWVPGLEVTYTQPMPTPADLAAFMAGKAPVAATVPQTPSKPAAAPTNGLPAPAAAARPEKAATYSRLRDGSWGLRATFPITDGQTITTETKAGARKTEKVGRVLWNGKGVWLATIAS